MRPQVTPFLLFALAAGAAVISSCDGAGRGPSMVDISDLDEAWDANNDPRRLRDRYVVQLAALPNTGTLGAATPWSDTYWPSYMGGLAQRWNNPADRSGFGYTPPTEAAVRAMSLQELAGLSPAEKYDIYLGNFDYPFLSSERARTSPDLPTWHGLCHGLAPASMVYKEPGAVTLTSASGINVPFGASDVKALLIYTQQARETRTASRQLGGRCNDDLGADPTNADEPRCRDVNAGSFHILLANTVGLESTPLIADLNRDQQVWNHPMIGYTTQILSQRLDIPPTAAPDTVRIATMRTTVRYVSGLGASWTRMPADRYPQQISARVYQYDLELDAGGNIVGGEWYNNDRPDFLWVQGAPQLTGYYAPVRTIYQAAIQAP